MDQSTAPSGIRWLELAEVDSTNAEAMRAALQGERGPLYIRADRQTAGKGRSGRAWETCAGNLALSRLGRLSCPPAAVPQLALVAGLAVHRAIAELFDGAEEGRALRLKWPNDVLLDHAKVAGILVESSAFAGERVAVIGVGVNLAEAPDVPGRATIALAGRVAQTPSPRQLAARVARHLEGALAQWDHGRRFDLIRAGWLAAALPLGTALSINTGQGVVSGRFAGLDEGGALRLDVPGLGAKSFSFGDVALIGG